MSKYNHFITENIAPKGTKIINVYNKGQKIGVIPLGSLTPPTSTKQYSFCVISDVHVQYDTAESDLIRALQYVENNDIEFTCICGDLTSGGTHAELKKYKEIIDLNSTKPVYATSGNHETAAGDPTDRVPQYTENPIFYSVEKGNDVFIFTGYRSTAWSWTDFLTVDNMQWLYETLERYRNKRCFVFQHVYPYQHGVGDAGRYYGGFYWSTSDKNTGELFINLLKHYKNTILFHGHSHLRFHLQEISTKANYSSEFGYRSVHIPSLAVPRDRVNDVTEVIFAESEGYIVDVYDGFIILNGRDFIDNGRDGNIIPIGTYKIDTTLQYIPEKSFVDVLGLIDTNK